MPKSRTPNDLRVRSIVLTMLLILVAPAMSQNEFPEIDSLRVLRDDYINHFRRTGEFRDEIASQLERNATATADTATGELAARARYELATVLRLTGRFEEAITQFHKIATMAEALGLSDVAFDAWIGIARAHAYGTADHGASAAAIATAIEIAGTQPTPKQRYEIADYSAQLQTGRGDLQSALINALDAQLLASSPDQAFYAALGVGDVLQKFAESCDYQKLFDARSHEDDDPWGGCRRAATSAEHYYLHAQQLAEKLGWGALARQAAGFHSRLRSRLMIIESKARFDTMVDPGIFSALDAGDVLVNDNFEAGASGISEYQVLGELISEVADEETSNDPRTQFLLGLQQDIQADPTAALRHFERAAELLAAERSSFFDIRGRGTVVENRPEFIRDLGLRLLALGRQDAAFDVFESMRASGLSSLRGAIVASPLDKEDRGRFATLVGIESLASGLRRKLVETIIAGVDLNNADAWVAEIRSLEARSRELRRDEQTADLVARLGNHRFQPTTLADLTRLANDSKTAVALYWVTPTNVLVWFLSPEGTEIKTVFLPESVLNGKVEALVASLQGPDGGFAMKEAKELHTYLLAPFAHHLRDARLLVVPQGTLVELPFEVLVDAKSDNYLIEDTEVAYAPNATMAAEFLQSASAPPTAVAVVFDPQIEATTQEVASLTQVEGLEFQQLSSTKAAVDQTLDFLSSQPAAHVLLHGVFSAEGDPLQSYLNLSNLKLRGDAGRVTAAELLQVDWRFTRLAVFSACEGARVTARISNEIHGLSWAPLVGGANEVVLSRWRVNAATNSQWMKTFYRALAEGAATASAVSRAMRELLAGDRTHPHYWAGPQLYGR